MGNLVLLWKSCLRWKDRNPQKPSFIRDKSNTDIYELIHMLAIGNLSEMELFDGWISIRRKLGAPLSYNDYLPNARIQALMKTWGGGRPSLRITLEYGLTPTS